MWFVIMKQNGFTVFVKPFETKKEAENYASNYRETFEVEIL